MKKIIITITALVSFFLFIYLGISFYISYSILYIDSNCGLHEGSKPNNWNTKIDQHEYKIFERRELRQNFPSELYHLHLWQDVYFPSKDSDIKINGWLFNYFKNRPIVIVVHGIFPNGKCKPESNLIASLLIKNKINALTIDLRNYGQSDTVSNFENLGLTGYKDVLGAFDFLKKIGFSKNDIGLHGISLGASTVIFAAANEPEIKAVWSESSLAEFKLILNDEISRYNMPNVFGPGVSFFGKILTGIDPAKLSPAKKLNKNTAYFFTHGKKDTRIPIHHFEYFQKYSKENNIKSNFWLVSDAYHVDAMFKYPEEYGFKLKRFFEENLK